MRKSRSTMRTLLAVAMVFFITTTAIFISLFVYYFIRFQQSGQKKPGDSNMTGQTKPDYSYVTGQTKPDYSNMTGQTKPDYSNMTGQTKPDYSNMTGQTKPDYSNMTGQTKPDYSKVTAALMIKKMNRLVDPCEDFHEYACGRFNRDEVIPPGYTQLTVFTFIYDQNQLVMKDIISGEVTSEQPRYLQNMKRYYKSCMDIAQIENTGLPAFLKEPYSREWPTLNSAWNATTFDLNNVIARYAVIKIWTLFGVAAVQDYKNSSRKVLYLVDAGLGLSQDYYSLPRNHSRLMAYQKFYVDIAATLGANVSTAELDAGNVVDLEIALSKIMASKTERQDFNKVYNPVNMSELATMYPSFNISRAIRALYATGNITIPDDETVVNMYPAYMANLHGVLTRFSGRDIQNLFSFRFALNKVQDLSKRMREVRLDFDKVISGKTEEIKRRQDCLSRTSTTFWKGMSKQFVARTFSQQAKTYMEEMIDNLKKSFREIIEESTWMGPTTKETAYKKLAAMKFKIGYPDTNFTDEEIETEYEHYNMLEENFYSNTELVTRLSILDSLASLRKPIDKNEWKMAPHDVNAYYSPTANEIAFLAGVLQTPVFSQTFQDYINYGAVGMVIGHEITHGFDIQGGQFDGDGNLVNWWQKSDREVFLNKSQCIQDQCSSFRMDEVNMTANGKLHLPVFISRGLWILNADNVHTAPLNGINMFKESIADNGGLKESFRAYKKLVSRKGENPVLPHLGLTQDQLFFLAFGQLWCEKITRESLINQLTSGTHPPGKFRIIGTLQNSEDFAKAYNCPNGSYMNPVKKCVVW